MKFGALFSGLFWGILIILIGASIIVRVVFKIDFPLLRIIFALFLITIGVTLLVTGIIQRTHRSNVIFTEANMKYSEMNNEYNIIFGKGDVDLTTVALKKRDRHIEINTIFADGKLILNPKTPAVVRIESVFAAARTPNGAITSFGNSVYKTPAYKDKSPHALRVTANVVFGQLTIIEAAANR